MKRWDEGGLIGKSEDLLLLWGGYRNVDVTDDLSYVFSDVDGGGPSLQLTLLYRKFPVSEKSTGKIVIAVGFSPTCSMESRIPYAF